MPAHRTYYVLMMGRVDVAGKTKKAISAFVLAAESNIWEKIAEPNSMTSQTAGFSENSKADLCIYLERKGRCLEARPSI